MSTQPRPPATSLSGALRANQKPLMIGGAALVAVFAYAKHRASAGSSSAGSAVDGYTTQPATGQAAYDSTGTDVYNALQPQIEQTQGMLQKLLDAQAAAPSPVPTPTPIPPAPHPVAPPPRRTPPPAGHKHPTTTRYTVRKGDNLTTIGRRYGVSWRTIYNANRGSIRNPNLIYPGQSFVIPHG